VRSWEENRGPGVTFEIECKQKGKSIIHYHTAGDAEQEVLFPPSTKFLITKVAKKSDGEDLVWMTEIVDEPSMTDVVAALVVPPVDTLNVLGSHWVNGVRRSARHQPKMGSVFVNGLRRSARRLATR
jgi:hypothetical protein